MPARRSTPWLDPWRSWYQLERWRKLRRAQLRREPLCRSCAARGMVTMADIADHIESHHGDWNAFVTGELQSLCSACHAQKARPFCYDGRRILSLARFRAKEAARRRTRRPTVSALRATPTRFFRIDVLEKSNHSPGSD